MNRDDPILLEVVIEIDAHREKKFFPRCRGVDGFYIPGSNSRVQPYCNLFMTVDPVTGHQNSVRERIIVRKNPCGGIRSVLIPAFQIAIAGGAIQGEVIGNGQRDAGKVFHAEGVHGNIDIAGIPVEPGHDTDNETVRYSMRFAIDDPTLCVHHRDMENNETEDQRNECTGKSSLHNSKSPR